MKAEGNVIIQKQNGSKVTISRKDTPELFVHRDKDSPRYMILVKTPNLIEESLDYSIHYTILSAQDEAYIVVCKALRHDLQDFGLGSIESRILITNHSIQELGKPSHICV